MQILSLITKLLTSTLMLHSPFLHSFNEAENKLQHITSIQNQVNYNDGMIRPDNFPKDVRLAALLL